MDNEKIKEILLNIQESELEFSVVMTGKESKRVNGLYKPETREILLHNKNFHTDNELIYTAIHEYTHHLINEEQIQANGGREPPHQARSHTNYFWAKFHALLETASDKGYYKGNIRMQFTYRDGTLKENSTATCVSEDYRTVCIGKNVSAYTDPDQKSFAFSLNKGEEVTADKCSVSPAKMLLRVKKGSKYGWILLGKGVLDLEYMW